MDLSRTKRALLAYDLAMSEIDARLEAAESHEETLALFHEIDDHASRVGAAYAADMAGKCPRNVALYIRPDAWLRGLVEKYGGAPS